VSGEEEIPEGYLASLEGAEWYAILSRGAIGFRYGPYSAIEAGALMQQCNLEGIPLFLSAVCGKVFDWDVARDFARGVPHDWREMDSAPRDGTPIMADVNGVETRVLWWLNWECWRELADNGRDIGKPVEPLRWHPVDEAAPTPLKANPDTDCQHGFLDIFDCPECRPF
jgi:hypothetical protein